MKIGEFVIFDITDPKFYGGKVSQEFNALWDNGNAPWFFQPADWIQDGVVSNYGSPINNRTMTLSVYSLGHTSKEKAIKAVEEWEIQNYLENNKVSAFLSLF